MKWTLDASTARHDTSAERQIGAHVHAESVEHVNRLVFVVGTEGDHFSSKCDDVFHLSGSIQFGTITNSIPAAWILPTIGSCSVDATPVSCSDRRRRPSMPSGNGPHSDQQR
jgi:hypothetical protein